MESQGDLFKVIEFGNSLAYQWLGLGAFTAVGWGSIPVWGTKILQATQRGQKKKMMFYIALKNNLQSHRV